MILPKKNKKGEYYVSYSQLSKWRRSKSEYFKQYFYNVPFKGNAYTDFGSKVGEALETGDFSGFSGVERTFIEIVPRLDEFEREVRLNFEGWHIKGYIDANDATLTHIVDYKTGSVDKEDEYRSDKYDQIQLYALAIEQETGVRPTKGEVLLIERTGNAFSGEELKLGSMIVHIEQPLDDKTMDRVKKEAEETAKDISRHWEAFNYLIGKDVKG